MTDAAPDSPLTVEDVIRSALRASAERLLSTEVAAIADAPDGVHQHRTAVRRLRSLLAAMRGHLDDSAAQRLRLQFAEWGGQLGVVRDIEVRAEVAEAAMDELGLDDDDLRRRLVDEEHEEYSRAHARLVELHDEPRSVARMADLAAYVADPPFTAKAHADAGALRQVARKEARRVRRAARRSDGSIETLHDVRKAGRRLRYVAEALHEAQPDVFGEDYEALASAGEHVHDVLGDHRDELIFIERLELARTRAGRAGERVEPYDELMARSARRAGDSIAGLDDALDQVRRAGRALKR
jgi:CHAD domain-containing protein